MDAPALPDDPRDWPTDPFSLLGVTRSVSEADLKRAYTRLIKKYKPEHKPEEFRRIREAYEAAVEMSRWYHDAPPVRETFRDIPFTPPAPPDAPPPASDAPQATSNAPPETRIDPPVRPVFVDPIEEAWADAVAGKWADAYLALASLAEAYPHRVDLALRLYWLLALRPTLDDARTRHDWLAAALTRARLAGPSVELYRRELAVDPSVALYAPYLKLLELPDVNGRHRLAFATLRLAAAADESRWALLDLDLVALTPHIREFDESEWLRYLTELTGRVAVDRSSLYERCRQLLGGLRHLELRHAGAFDLLEHRHQTVWNLRHTRIPDEIRQALITSLIGSDNRKTMKAAILWAANDPAAALRECDVGMATQTGYAFLAIFGRILAERADRLDVYPPELIRQFFHAYVARGLAHDYDSIREPLLQFLLAERIDPEELVDACSNGPHRSIRVLIHYLRDDESLRLVYRTASAAV